MRVRTKKITHEVVSTRGEDVGTFQVMPMDVTETNKLLKKFTTHEKYKGQVMPETNFLGFQLAKINKVITGWDIEDENGLPLECNDENKKLVFVLNPDLINDVIDKADKIAAGAEEIEQATEKN